MNSSISKVVMGITGVTIIAAIFLMASATSKTDNEFLEQYNLNNFTIKELVSTLEDRTDEPDALYSGISSTQLGLGDQSHDLKYDLPDDEFYLSIAPYINDTHPCADHNLITCRGELQNVTMQIVVTDDNGNIIIDDDYNSYSNGFTGLWLPRDMDGTITVTYDGKQATSDITTYDSSNTCLTTLKLT